ncbi:MAG: hypothetical protein JW982_03265 [Spirochaetes bacterium]|nr:hypothetical protein [Spirochaetota bacterium]
MHRTSLNVSNFMITQLNFISKKYKIDKKTLIARIFSYCHNNLNFEQYVGGLTRYQKLAAGDTWKCLRMDFSDMQCDIYFFYRNKFRISLSRLLAAGFFLFFDQIIDDLNKEVKIEIETLTFILNSYTDLKSILKHYLSETFKHFNLKQENTG